MVMFVLWFRIDPQDRWRIVARAETTLLLTGEMVKHQRERSTVIGEYLALPIGQKP